MATTLHELHDKITMSNEFHHMGNFVEPMLDYFGVNHFYYCQIDYFGNFIGLGTNLKWQEYIFDDVDVLASCPIFNNAKEANTEIILDKLNEGLEYNSMLQSAWSKFKINFTIKIQRKILGGVQWFGFGLKSNHVHADQYMVNNLPVLNKFADLFLDENIKLLRLAKDYRVNISESISAKKNCEVYFPDKVKSSRFLEQMGLKEIEMLSQ